MKGIHLHILTAHSFFADSFKNFHVHKEFITPSHCYNNLDSALKTLSDNQSDTQDFLLIDDAAFPGNELYNFLHDLNSLHNNIKRTLAAANYLIT